MKKLKNDVNLSRQILDFSNSDLSNVDLISQLLNIVIDFSGSDLVLIFWKNNGNVYSYEINRDHNIKFDTVPGEKNLYNSAYKSVISFPLVIDNIEIGSLSLMNKKDNYFSESEKEEYNDQAINIGFVLKNHKVQSDLKERVKELTCLYGISKIVERKNLSIEQTLQEIVSLLPTAFQYPEIAFSQIVLDEKAYNTKNFQESSFTDS
ncbi:MAG: hypothetical protein NTY22_03095 [Proteobacteria bacterium]|nr:hypothetical protein [Pseudomonadota bacterium]